MVGRCWHSREICEVCLNVPTLIHMLKRPFYHRCLPTNCKRPPNFHQWKEGWWPCWTLHQCQPRGLAATFPESSNCQLSNPLLSFRDAAKQNYTSFWGARNQPYSHLAAAERRLCCSSVLSDRDKCTDELKGPCMSQLLIGSAIGALGRETQLSLIIFKI